MEFELEKNLGFVIGRTSARLKNELSRALKKYHVTSEQFILLTRLWEQDGISQKELANKCFKDQPSTTRILDKLEQGGFVRRQPSPYDRRAYLVLLTASGQALQKKIIPEAAATLERALQGFTAKETALIIDMLNRVNDNLQSEGEQHVS